MEDYLLNQSWGLMLHHFHDDINHKKGQGSIDANLFKKLLGYVSEKYNLVNADQFLIKHQKGSLTNEVCITLDDSLKCQYDVALPILKKMGVSAFFFVYTNAFKTNPESLEFYRDFRNNYFDNIENFYLEFFKIFMKTNKKDFKIYKESYPENYLNNFPFYTENDRKFRFVRDKVLGHAKYCQIMDKLLEEKNYCKSDNKDKLFMSMDNLKDISDYGHIVGLHSTSHPTCIDEMSYSSQLQEYRENYNFVYSVTNKKPISMSHPCGKYNKSTISILHELGIKLGFRSSISKDFKRSNLEVPREDHSNLIKKFKLI